VCSQFENQAKAESLRQDRILALIRAEDGFLFVLRPELRLLERRKKKLVREMNYERGSNKRALA
jgi:hypothetical protein